MSTLTPAQICQEIDFAIIEVNRDYNNSLTKEEINSLRIDMILHQREYQIGKYKPIL